MTTNGHITHTFGALIKLGQHFYNISGHSCSSLYSVLATLYLLRSCCHLFCTDQTITADLKQDEEKAVEKAAIQPPCLVILGQSVAVCAEITNWIFDIDILPKPRNLPFRTITFRFGQRNRITLLDDPSSRNRTATTGGILSSSGKQVHPWSLPLPLRCLEVNDTESDSCTVDVRANLHLLEYGAHVTVIGCSSHHLVEVYENSIADVAPVVIYAFQGDSLSKEVGCMDNLLNNSFIYSSKF